MFRYIKMAMIVENSPARKLAHKLSNLTGESLIAAVTDAISEPLERVRNVQGAGLADRLLRIGKDCAAHLEEAFRSADHEAILYDDRGLPLPTR